MFKSKSSQYDRIYAPCIFKLGFKNVEINLELSDEIYIYIYIFFLMFSRATHKPVLLGAAESMLSCLTVCRPWGRAGEGVG